ncbi:MAG: ribbon-helix-helix protein, CopG family [Promethearchaeota archaeon]|nr:MAG: ribbon-helix-helix protein, CopG family [Candidatus Lokiarchaeota archaeon]
MVFIPIVSVSLNDNLKKFLDKLISKNKYKNKSKLIRDAILRLQQSPDFSNMDAATIDFFTPLTKKIIGNMIIVVPNDINILKKLNKIENKYCDQIVSKNQQFYTNNPHNTFFLVFEGSLQDFRSIVVEINSIKEIKNFRYLIIN